jgi:hypothetical protein
MTVTSLPAAVEQLDKLQDQLRQRDRQIVDLQAENSKLAALAVRLRSGIADLHNVVTNSIGPER